MNPVLSVIIPVYNAEQYLDDTISSLLNQSLKEIEIIFVDDGSLDRSVSIIQSYMATEPRIVLISQEHKNAGPARNAGLKAAKGDYVHFLDADDYVIDYGYETIIKKCIKNKLECLKFGSIRWDEKAAYTVNKEKSDFGNLSAKDFETVLNYQNCKNLASINATPWSGIYLRSFLLDHHIEFNDLLCVNDRSFFKKVLISCKRMMVSKDMVVIHRLNVSQSLISKRAENFECHYQSIQIIEKDLLKAQLNKEEFKQLFKDEFNDLFYWLNKVSTDNPFRDHALTITKQAIKKYSEKYSYIKDYYFLYKSAAENKKPSLSPSANTYFKYYYDSPVQPSLSIYIDPIESDHLSFLLNDLSKIKKEDLSFIFFSKGLSQIAELSLKNYMTFDHRFQAEEIPSKNKTGTIVHMNRQGRITFSIKPLNFFELKEVCLISLKFLVIIRRFYSLHK